MFNFTQIKRFFYMIKHRNMLQLNYMLKSRKKYPDKTILNKLLYEKRNLPWNLHILCLMAKIHAFFIFVI